MRYHLTPLKTAIIKKNPKINARGGVERRGLSYTIVGNVNWCSHNGEQHRGSLKKKKKTKSRATIWPCNPTSGHIPRKKHGPRVYMQPTAALFTMAKTWKQPKGSLTGIDKEDVVHIYNEILLSHYKEWNNAICSNMEGPRDCHAEWSKSDREGKISYDIPNMKNLKGNDTNELIYETETDSQTQRMNLWLAAGEEWGEEIWNLGLTCTHCYI